MVTALQESLTTHPLQTLIEADQPGVLAIITEIDGPASVGVVVVDGCGDGRRRFTFRWHIPELSAPGWGGEYAES